MRAEIISPGAGSGPSKIRVAVIVGSVRDGRFGPVVAEWFVARARQRTDFEVDVIDLIDVPLPLTISDKPPAEVAEVTQRLKSADAFVVVTPEYNHSFPASVKNVIDWHFTEWQAKPVGFVSYGGLAGGLRAVEQLRLVFAELHAVTVRETVSFHQFWEQFDGEGRPKDATSCNRAAETLLEQLAWWAAALGTARAARPYTVASA